MRPTPTLSGRPSASCRSVPRSRCSPARAMATTISAWLATRRARPPRRATREDVASGAADEADQHPDQRVVGDVEDRLVRRVDARPRRRSGAKQASASSGAAQGGQQQAAAHQRGVAGLQRVVARGEDLERLAGQAQRDDHGEQRPVGAPASWMRSATPTASSADTPTPRGRSSRAVRASGRCQPGPPCPAVSFGGRRGSLEPSASQRPYVGRNAARTQGDTCA